MISSAPTILFVHRGYSPYLPVTLKLARDTNPTAVLYLLGDAPNRDIAVKCGWAHIDYATLETSALQRFRSCYRLISTPDHPDTYLPFDMTRFCFERYFLVAQLASQQRLERFWMFDSDDLLVEDIAPFQSELLSRSIDFTRMAHNTAVRGMIDRRVVDAFCEHVVGRFEDPDFVAEQTQSFARRSSMAAFTDMNAAESFVCSHRGVHLADSCEGWHFDDCILHEDGFEKVHLGHLRRLPVKHVRFDGARFTGIRDGLPVRFATINGSGLPRQIFPWFLDCVAAREKGQQRPSGIRAYQPSVAREFAYVAKSRAKAILGQLMKGRR